MTVLIIFQEAYKNANDGDKITDEYDNFIIKGGTDAIFSVSSIMKKNWQIIPAEPKILTDKEIINSIVQVGHNPWSIKDAKSICEAARKRGRLEEWGNHKELREAIEGLDVSKIHQALKNLKPLNP